MEPKKPRMFAAFLTRKQGRECSFHSANSLLNEFCQVFPHVLREF